MNKKEYKKPEIVQLTSDETHGKKVGMAEQGNGSAGWAPLANAS